MAGTTRVTVEILFLYTLHGKFTFFVSSDVVSPTDPIILGYITVLEAITRGKAIHIEISLSQATISSATSGATYISEDKAFMRFRDEFGVGHNYKVPGPKTTVFLTNHEDVDTSLAAVIAFNAAVNTYAKGRGGNDITTFIKGYRKENRKMLKGGRAT